MDKQQVLLHSAGNYSWCLLITHMESNNMKKSVCIYCVTLLCSSNQHNTAIQLYFSVKTKTKKGTM